MDVIEKLNWRTLPRWVFEQTCTIFFLILPTKFLKNKLCNLIAEKVYHCNPSQIILYKSGRAALCAVLKHIKNYGTERKIVLIPDYTCNVVARACSLAGFKVETYATKQNFEPEWSELRQKISDFENPVVILCAMFGAEPVQSDHVKDLYQAGALIIADECQNMVPNTQICRSSVHAVIFSFNDKTCPGIMGGGVVWHDFESPFSFFDKVTFTRRIKCSAGLFKIWLSRLFEDIKLVTFKIIGFNVQYRIPEGYEFSRCVMPHYDFCAEPIYKLSLTRALISVANLYFYKSVRKRNIEAIEPFLLENEIINHGAVVAKAPPFVPLRKKPILLQNKRYLPFPLKAPYALDTDFNKTQREQSVIKLTNPLVNYAIK